MYYVATLSQQFGLTEDTFEKIKQDIPYISTFFSSASQTLNELNTKYEEDYQESHSYRDTAQNRNLNRFEWISGMYTAATNTICHGINDVLPKLSLLNANLKVTPPSSAASSGAQNNAS